MKIKKEPLSVDLTENLDKKSLLAKLGISEFIARVALDILLPVSESGLSLIQTVCLNPGIHALNHYEIDVYRADCVKKKKSPEEETKKKTITDDEIRKFIIEKREKELNASKVLIGGTTDQYDKLDSVQKDSTMVREFVGFALTNHHYCVYAYYIGPSFKGINNAELHNPSNWVPVHKKHLGHFHRRLRSDVKSYYTQTRYDQWSFPGERYENPSYDPRFIADRWLNSKEGKTLKSLLKENASLFTDAVKDHYVVKCESGKEANSLHYYDGTKGEPFAPKITTTASFDVEADRLQQQKSGYRLSDEALCHVDIDEFPELPRIPLSRDITFSFEEYVSLAKRVFVENEANNTKASNKPPDYYRWDPWVAVKAATMSLNPEMVIRNTSTLLADKHIQIVEADNITPILEYFASNKECVDEIKDSTERLLFAMMTTEIMTREHPSHLHTRLNRHHEEEEDDEIENPYKMLDL